MVYTHVYKGDCFYVLFLPQMVTVGGESSPVIPLESGSAQRVAGGGSGLGPRTVVAKPLPPRQQMSPALTNLVPAHQTPSPLQGVYNHKYMHTHICLGNM